MFLVPYRDDGPARAFPLVTIGIILLNAVVFMLELRLDESQLTEFVRDYGLVPSSFAGFSSLMDLKDAARSLITFMFLHGSLTHFVGNMWFLWLFGDNVESRLGRRRFLLLYLMSGAIGGIAHVALNWRSPAPCVGASSAVAGVMGAYLMLFPRAKVRTLFLLVIVPLFFAVPAWAFILVWFAVQVHSGLGQVAMTSNIAFWAHVGGFIAGVWLQGELKPPRRPRERYVSGF